jgi:hypothetical protein
VATLRELLSPDILKDYESQAGGVEPLMAQVLAARYGEASADPSLKAMTPEDRAILDRYANFALLSQQSTNPIEAGANYLGGMGAMAATESLKYAKPLQGAASSAWNALTGGNAQFFGGKDTSSPSIANLLAAHYGFMRGREKK